MKIINYLTLFLLILTACQNSKNKSISAYEIELAKERTENESYLIKNAIVEPSNFKGLEYFEPDTTLIFNLKITKTNPELLVFATNTERKPEYYRVGTVRFKVKDSDCQLSLFSSKTDWTDIVFIPFKDLTNRELTYGAGRYIETKAFANNDSITLDFNRAFNPYCHYSDKFSCPIVPLENHLKVHLMAGEKKLH